MASSAPIPPQPPRRCPSFAGPLVLIAVGVLFLLRTMGVLPWDTWWHWFAHYWPVLLIVLGVIKLIEHYQAQRTGARSSGMGLGGAFLLVIFIFFGLAASQMSRVDWDAMGHQFDWDDGNFGWFGHTYEYDDQLQQDFPGGGASLRVTDTRGAITVNTSDDEKIHVAVHKRIKADSQGEADKRNSGTKPEIKVNGNVVSLDARNQAAGDHWVAIDLDISVPRGAAVNISNRYGDVTVTDREADLDISNQKGNVSVEKIKGRVNLSLEDSSAHISDVSGDVSAQGRVNDISVDNVKGAVRLGGDFSDSVSLSKLAKGVILKSSRTELELARLDGDLSLDPKDLRASDLIGPVKVDTKFKDISLDGVTGDLRLDNEDAPVEVRISKLGSVQMQNKRADITIYVPDKAGFQLNAQTRNADIQSDFNNVNISTNNDQTSATGTVGGGGPHVVLNNEHATIEIRKGSTMANAPRTPRTASPDSSDEPEATDN
jgi:surface antigen